MNTLSCSTSFLTAAMLSAGEEACSKPSLSLRPQTPPFALISSKASVMLSRPGVPMKASGPVRAPIAPIEISEEVIPFSWAGAPKAKVRNPIVAASATAGRVALQIWSLRMNPFSAWLQSAGPVANAVSGGAFDDLEHFPVRLKSSCSGLSQPSTSWGRGKGVDARQRRQVYAVCTSLTALPGVTVVAANDTRGHRSTSHRLRRQDIRPPSSFEGRGRSHLRMTASIRVERPVLFALGYPPRVLSSEDLNDSREIHGARNRNRPYRFAHERCASICGGRCQARQDRRRGPQSAKHPA